MSAVPSCPEERVRGRGRYARSVPCGRLLKTPEQEVAKLCGIHLAAKRRREANALTREERLQVDGEIRARARRVADQLANLGVPAVGDWDGMLRIASEDAEALIARLATLPAAPSEEPAGWIVSCGWRPTERDPEPRDYPRSYPSWADARQIGRALACGDNVIAVTITAPDGSEAATWSSGGVWRERVGLPEEPATTVRCKMCGGSLSDHQDPHARPRHPWTPDQTAEEPAPAEGGVEKCGRGCNDASADAACPTHGIVAFLQGLPDAPPAPTSGEGGQS